jgi:hypothetical protein
MRTNLQNYLFISVPSAQSGSLQQAQPADSVNTIIDEHFIAEASVHDCFQSVMEYMKSCFQIAFLFYPPPGA